MYLPIEKQKEFIKWQIQEHEEAYLSYLSTPMLAHFKYKSAFWGKIWGVDEKRLSLIIRFKRSMAPRINYAMAGFVYGGIPNPEEPEKWDFTYEYFRRNYSKGMSEMTPIYYLDKSNKEWATIGFKDIDAEFFEIIKNQLQKGKNPSIFLAEKDPPIQYLLNLYEFIEKYPKDEVLNMNIEKSLDEWKPLNLKASENKVAIVNTALENADILIIQGPPGTGKSHLIGEIADHFLQEGKSICITTLTNKALMEVVEKPGLLKWVEKDCIFKTNLITEESKRHPKLKLAKNLVLSKTSVLLSTYYKLSDWYKKDSSNLDALKSPIYDIVIIEEASQSFLATIACFKRLGKKVLIVGDPMQLPPIVLNENKAINIHPNIMSFARGLDTYVANSGVKSYRLVESFRLNPAAAKSTGIFYNNDLFSATRIQKILRSSKEYKYLIPEKGDSKIGFIPMISDGEKPTEAINVIAKFVYDLKLHNPGIEIAVLAPFRKTVQTLQEKLGMELDDFSGITIETIDRIQGLTVDFTIYLLALSNPRFGLNVNRFNVATSRAKSGTLIITDKGYVEFMGIDKKVTEYLSKLDKFDI
jgi:superfamily I DNA and/or RNA helicase